MRAVRSGAATLSILALAACGTESTGNQDDSSDQYTLSIASVTGEETAQGRTLLDFQEAVETASDGRLQVELHQNGTLGGEFETLDQLQAGALEGMLAHGIILFQPQIPELAVEELPFLFPSSEAAYEAIDGEFGEAVTERIEELDIEVLSYWENGFRHLTNDTRPIETPEDMEGLQFRTAESDIRLDLFSALNASAVPMPFTEVYTGLEQGTIDGQENPLSITYNSGFADVQDYLSLTGHLWAAQPLVVSGTWFETLPGDLQEILREEATELKSVQRERIQEADEQLIAELEDAGMEITEPDTEAFVEATEVVWEDWADVIGEEFMGMAEDIRDSETE